MSRLFDRYVVVDWSGASTPVRGANGIWIESLLHDGERSRSNPPTRAQATAALIAALAESSAAGERVLIGLDISFGWPAGFAQVVTGDAHWRTLWARLADEIEDDENNRHNAFAWAAAANDRFPKPGPFWGDPYRGRRPPAPPPLKRFAYGAPAEWRRCERFMSGAKSGWQMAYAGAVGAQSLLGVPRLAQIRAACPASRVWPLETGWGPVETKAGDIIIAELYLSLFAESGEPDMVKDARQVRGAAQSLAGMDAAGDLAPLFESARPSVRAVVEGEEGWTLGAP